LIAECVMCEWEAGLQPRDFHYAGMHVKQHPEVGGNESLAGAANGGRETLGLKSGRGEECLPAIAKVLSLRSASGGV
jgi:hypothetical protein